MSLLECEESQLLLEDATVTAGTVRGCRQRLTRFLERYLPLFYRQEQREHAQLVVAGRLGNLDRKTCEPIARQAGVERKPIQLFVGGGKWDDERVMAEVRQHVAETFADPQAVLVVDSSGFPKKGTESCGVQRQWCGRLGKVDNCQVGVFLACVSQGRVAPLHRRLYLPREWAEDRKRRGKSHVPKGLRFAEKWQLALKLLKESWNVPHGWVVADDEFGRAAEFRATLRRRRERYVLDVPCNTLVRILQPPQPPTAQGSKQKSRGAAKPGRPRKPPFVRADAWAAEQPAARWQRLEVRAGERGPLVVEFLEAGVQTRQRQRIGAEEHLLVIRTVETAPQTHYCLSNATAPTAWEDAVRARMERHRVEEMFAQGNGEVGLDHYEVRSWVGWHHHVTLSLLALWFLVLEKQRVGEKISGDHSTPDARDLQPTAPTAQPHGRPDRRRNHRRIAA